MKNKKNNILAFVFGFVFAMSIWIFNAKIPFQVKNFITENKLVFTCKIDKYFNYNIKTEGKCIDGKFVKKVDQGKFLQIYENEFLIKLDLPKRSIFDSTLPDNNEIDLILGINNLNYEYTECKNLDKNFNECLVYYENLPPVKFFASKKNKKDVVILLHGHSSNSKHTLGFLEEEDYMRSIGKYLLSNNLDVVSLELTSSIHTGKKINDLLLFYGTTLYGLYAKTVCIIAKELKSKNVYIYGMSNGGMIALFSANICNQDNIEHVFVDDIFQNWFNTWTDSIKKYDLITQTYGYTFQKNFFYDFTDIVLLIKSNYKLFLTQKKLSDISDLQKCYVKNGEQDLFFLEKKSKEHVAENELFLETITNNGYDDYYAVDKDCLIANLKKSK